MRLPSGTVTLLFTDIEGSTRLLQELGEASYVRALERHRRLLRDVFAAHEGVEVEMQGDSFHFAFSDARDAVVAAAEAQAALAVQPWEHEPIRVRIGMHTGRPLVTGSLYAGLDVHRAARVMSAGHGGQVLLSDETRDAVDGRLSTDLPLRDLGEHRLKDLSAPQRLHQVGADDFPPLKSLYQSNLPVPATPFLGRERELQEVAALLGDDDVRLLTLTGAGGTGKSRLAAQAAADVTELFPDGVFWVGLATLRDPVLVMPAIAQALAAKGELADHIGAKRLLLLLDNFEHLLPAATDLANLLAACPRLTLLVTSRESLHLRSERDYVVPPLREPDAVTLFLERVRAAGAEAGPGEEIAAICRRLDQLPLAIELAAARVKVLSPRELLERLDRRLPLLSGGARDLPERQRTLRATIQWSFDLLAPDEQRLFTDLAVFVGGCTLAAAEQVCAADLDTLQSLVEKSLLRHTGERFWMLATIREFASVQLADTSEETTRRRRHAEYFAAVAEEAHAGLEGPEQPRWLHVLAADQPNLVAALDWALEHDDAPVALRLVAALGWFWFLRGPVVERRVLVDRALALGSVAPPTLRAEALVRAANLAQAAGDLENAGERYEEALALRRGLGDAMGSIRLLGNLGVIAQYGGDYEAAARWYGESMTLAAEVGHDSARAAALCNLGLLRLEEGAPADAAALFEQSRALAEELGHAFGLAVVHRGLALAALDRGDPASAASFLRTTLSICRELGATSGVGTCLDMLAELELAVGDAERAARALGAAAVMHADTGDALAPYERVRSERATAVARARLGDAAYALAWEEGNAFEMAAAAAWADERLETFAAVVPVES